MGMRLKKREREIFEKGKEFFDAGQFFDAHDYLSKNLKEFPNSIPLQQLAAQALNKIEAFEESINILQPLTRKKHSNSQSLEETWGNLGSVYKSIWYQTKQEEHAILSRKHYSKGFKETKGVWTGTNSATMHLITGDKNGAQKIAKKVVKIAKELYDGNIKNIQTLYWTLVNWGEALLLLDKPNEAIRRYMEAYKIYKDIPERKFHFLSTTAKQVVLLKEYGVIVPENIFKAFKPLQVVLFTGHMIDRKGKWPERFPQRLEDLVRDTIRSRLEIIKPKIGYSGAACGGDIIFIEEMLKLKAEVNIFLPFAEKDFIKESVKFAGGKWVERFQNALKKANTVKHVTTEKFLGDKSLFGFGGIIFQGYGRLRAIREGCDPIMLSVWDGWKPKKSEEEKIIGGTSYIIDKWHDKKNLDIIDIKELLTLSPNCQPKPRKPKVLSPDKNHEANRREIKSMLFSDVSGFSKLEEEQYTQFVHIFLKDISIKLAPYIKSLDFINTWGDAIFAAMPEEEIVKMTDFAFSLLNASHEALEKNDQLSQLNIRIALHVGPVFKEKDPITKRNNLYGCHVNRAARLEPATKLGHIYATEQFAALLTVKQSKKTISQNKYSCHYVGNLPLVKNFGDQAVYKIVKKN